MIYGWVGIYRLGHYFFCRNFDVFSFKSEICVQRIVKGRRFNDEQTSVSPSIIRLEDRTMTDAQKKKIRELRGNGYGYARISLEIGVSENTIKTFCKRNGLGGVASELTAIVQMVECKCKNCGKAISFPEGRKEKKFCSDKCRNAWWNSNLDKVERKALYEFTCLHCGKKGIAYGNNHRKFCDRECYSAYRKGEI